MGAWVWFSARAPVIDAPAVEAVTVPRTTDLVDESTTVSIVPVWTQPISLAYRGPGGLVTAVHVAPGDVVGQGSPLFDVDGHPFRVAVTAAPWPQALTAKSGRTSIAELNAFLAASGFPAGDGGVWGTSTGRGVQQYAAAMGIEGKVTQFEPSWVVWAPSELSVGAVEVSTGFGAPADGDKVLVAAARIGSATIESSSALDPAAFVVDVSGTTLALASGQTVAQESLVALEGVVPEGEERVDAVARLREPREVLTVPPSAVVTDQSGATCLLAVATAGRGVEVGGKAFEPFPADVIGGVPGVTYVTVVPGAPSGAILSNPSDFPSAVHC